MADATENINQVVYFHNPLEEDFTFTWDKAPYTVPAGATVPYPLFLAKHGGKHLIDKIILNPDCWAKLGLKRTDTEEKFDVSGRLTQMRSNLNLGREEIAKLINVTKPVEKLVKDFKAKNTLAEEKEEVFADKPKN